MHPPDKIKLPPERGNDDVWHLRYHWNRFQSLIQEQLRHGTYRFSPVRLIRRTAKNGFSWLWSAADAQVLGDCLRPLISSKCHHLAGNGASPWAAHGLEVTKKTIENHVARIAQLSEQGVDLQRIGTYVRHWLRWLNAGVIINHNLRYLFFFLCLPELATSYLEKTTNPKTAPFFFISNNGPQFVAKDLKEFIRINGMTHVRTSPFYPQSNGKQERMQGLIKQEFIRPKCPKSVEQARQSKYK